jgi:hypothetical protein
MKSSELVRIIDAAKRHTGLADPEIVFYDDDPKETIILSQFSEAPNKDIASHMDYYTNSHNTIRIPLKSDSV